MSTEALGGGRERADFVVRPDGTVVGEDGAAGALAAALPYTGRLARRAGELVGVGDLRALEAFGARRLTVGVTWTPAGEGTYRALLEPAEPRTVPTFMVVGTRDSTVAVLHCVERVMAVEGIRWSSVVTAGSRVVAAAGETTAGHLDEVGNRMLAILRSLEDQHVAGFVRLRFEQGAVIGASLGRHALVACTGDTSEDDLLTTIDEVRAILADRDLSTVPTQDAPDAAVVARAAEPAAPEVVEPAAPSPPPLVGARFAGAGEREPRRPGRRRRFGRGDLSPSPGETPRTSPRG